MSRSISDASHLPVTWVHSSRSGESGQCVEAGLLAGLIVIRDSKNPTGPATCAVPHVWRRFIGSVRAGRL